MKKLFLIIPSILLFISCTSQNNVRTFQAMNTFMKVSAYGKASEKATFMVEKNIQELEKLISTTDPESEVYRLNNSDGEKTKISEALSNLIEYSLKGIELTDGSFTPLLYPVTKTWGFTTEKYRVPSDEEISEKLSLCDASKIKLWKENGTEIQLEQGMAFDFGAVGKGLAGDRSIEILKANGIQSALLDLGGNIQLLGKKPDGSNWKVALKNPLGGQVPLFLEVYDCAVITSGGYERYFTADDGNKYIHIFDGKTGRPVENNLVSSTIVTKNGIDGDFLSTITFILGKEKSIELWRTYKECDFDFIMFFEDNSICYTKGLKDKITLLQDFTAVEVIE